ncbi:MAG TPA: type ISP restriction/modification enzyme, partial [Phycisphaerae bacterium]|nr:type ISP restriction/modification enzyme [Phycisphaerae bacterium]
FSARVNVPDHKAATFSREHAAYDLPATNPFLREVFDYIAGTKLDPSIVWAVDLLADILRRCDIGEILSQFGKAIRQEDPVVHFYETFLAAYDPALRESRGVYYTPEPVVSYIVHSIDAILRRDFACPEGLADHSKVHIDVPDPNHKDGKVRREVHRVQILDPATGTGTFLYETIRLIHESLKANRGIWAGEAGYVAQHLLPRLFGFELMMAPYAVAHLKLGWLLKDTGYDFAVAERLRVYLTNTLEEAEVVADAKLLFANQIAREANAASKVKTDCPIMVVLGNPPYSGHSANKGRWIWTLVRDYSKDCPELNKPAQAKWLQDDYVKFIRFGQYRIDRTGYGILAFITNHGYLDNPTFRGMRQSLMHTFDDIYVLDLHGSAKKKETAPDGSKDENVFDIMQGVAIGIFVKRRNGSQKKPARVLHAELWGLRDSKYEWLYANTVASTSWSDVATSEVLPVFKPQDEVVGTEYRLGLSIRDVFSPYGDPAPGVVTTHDQFAVSWSANDAISKVERLLATTSEQEARSIFKLCSQNQWLYERAMKELADGSWRNQVVPILYRPFDQRVTVYNRNVAVHRRERATWHMLAGENLALISARSNKSQNQDHFFCSNIITETKCGESTTQSALFPLYIFPTSESGAEKLFSEGSGPGKGGRRPNLSPEFVGEFGEKLGLAFVSDGVGDMKKTFGPEDVFHYAYAVFHSPTYRSRYAEFLKIDFPRLPLTSDRKLFARLCALGAELVELHLLERVPEPAASYPQSGRSVVDKPHYKPPTDQAPGRVYVNKDQYFDSVPPEVWEFHIGGYQVCQKWLKDRKARTLSYDDIQTYRKITEALRRTIQLMRDIDQAIPTWPLP